MSKRVSIPNPSKITDKEYVFLNNNKNLDFVKSKFKGRMISMSDEFYKKLNNFLEENPSEGNRSSFVVRVLTEYMKRY